MIETKWKVIIDDKEAKILDEDEAYEFRALLGMKGNDVFPSRENLENLGIRKIVIEQLFE